MKQDGQWKYEIEGASGTRSLCPGKQSGLGDGGQSLSPYSAEGLRSSSIWAPGSNAQFRQQRAARGLPAGPESCL